MHYKIIKDSDKLREFIEWFNNDYKPYGHSDNGTLHTIESAKILTIIAEEKLL